MARSQQAKTALRSFQMLHSQAFFHTYTRSFEMLVPFLRMWCTSQSLFRFKETDVIVSSPYKLERSLPYTAKIHTPDFQ